MKTEKPIIIDEKWRERCEQLLTPETPLTRASSTRGDRPRLVEIIADQKGRLSMHRFIRQIDKMINERVPSTHLWNYCLENRRAVLAKAEGDLGSEVHAPKAPSATQETKLSYSQLADQRAALLEAAHSALAVLTGLEATSVMAGLSKSGDDQITIGMKLRDAISACEQGSGVNGPLTH